MVVVGFKSLEEMVEKRIELNENIVAVINPQVIIKQGSKSYFYTADGDYVKRGISFIETEWYVGLVSQTANTLLENLKMDINKNKVILVENNGNPKLIKTDDISSVQIVVS